MRPQPREILTRERHVRPEPIRHHPRTERDQLTIVTDTGYVHWRVTTCTQWGDPFNYLNESIYFVNFNYPNKLFCIFTM